MNRLSLILTLAISVSAVGLTAYNACDTFLIGHSQGKILQSGNNPFDFDFDESEKQDASSLEEASKESQEESSFGQSSLSEEKTSKTPISSEDFASSSKLSAPLLETMKTTASYQKLTKTIKNIDVTYYLLEINLAKISHLRTYIATDEQGNYGKNITENFSSLVEKASADNNVIAAISGDFPFWSGRHGYVVRNGVSFREDQRRTDGEDMAIYKDGTIEYYFEKDVDFDSMYNAHGGCYQNWSFGPALLYNGEILVTEKQEIDGETMSSNQRVAIGYAGGRKFYFLLSQVAGSRSSSRSAAFSLHDLAKTFQELGCESAYNLDGGDSVSLFYDYGGYTKTVGGNKRKIGDIIYVVEG